MSCLAIENAIMDRYDAGEPLEAIAAAVRIRARTVESIIGYMRPGQADLATARHTVTTASNQLLAAIARHHPDRIPAPAGRVGSANFFTSSSTRLASTNSGRASSIATTSSRAKARTTTQKGPTMNDHAKIDLTIAACIMDVVIGGEIVGFEKPEIRAGEWEQLAPIAQKTHKGT